MVNYILKTGAVLKGKIDKVDVNMTIVGYMPHFEFSVSREGDAYNPVSVSQYGVVKWHMDYKNALRYIPQAEKARFNIISH